MASHVSSSGLRLGGASDDTASPVTQGAAPHFNTPAMVKYRLIQAGASQFPQTAFFLFEPVLEGNSFITDGLRAALFVTSSASLQLLGLEIIALHPNFSPIILVYTLDACAYM
jgi:hypothetical protein